MAKINDPPQVKIDSNIAKVNARWEKMLSRRPRTLLANMQAATMLVKSTVAAEKLQGQVLHRRTGNLLRSLLPNTPAVAGRLIGENIVVGTVGAQGARAPYAKPLEEGAKAHIIVPRNARALMIPIGQFAKGQRVKKGSGIFRGRGGAMVIFRMRANIPALVGRWYIRNTIRERSNQIKAQLAKDMVKFD